MPPEIRCGTSCGRSRCDGPLCAQPDRAYASGQYFYRAARVAFRPIAGRKHAAAHRGFGSAAQPCGLCRAAAEGPWLARAGLGRRDAAAEHEKPGLCRTFCKTGGAGPDLPVLLLPQRAARRLCAPCLGRHGALSRCLPRPDAGAARRKDPPPRVARPCAGYRRLVPGRCLRPADRAARRDLRRFYRPTLRRRVCLSACRCVR